MSRPQHVYLLRHGYSTFQERYDVTKTDPGIVDARLTGRGHDQARAVAPQVARLDIELVVTSPLTRAIETMFGVFHGTPIPPVRVDALLRERLGDACDIGRTPEDLAREFPGLDFAHLPQRWWYDGPLDARGVPMEPWSFVEERAQQFAAWLRSRPECAVLVISHHGMLRSLSGTEIANCELFEWTGELPVRHP